MAKIVFVIAYSGFRDEEYFESAKLLQNAGHSLTTASTTVGQAVGSRGGHTTVDCVISDISAQDFDVIVLIGGPGSYQLDDNAQLRQLLRDFAAANKLIAAICHAPIIVAKAGLLQSKPATVFSGDSKELISLGARYQNTPVIQDENIITADGPGSATLFGQHIHSYITKNS